MRVALRCRVHVDVNDRWVSAEMRGCQSGLLEDFPDDPVRQRLPRIDMATGLDPDPQTLVPMKDHPAPPDDKCRRSDVKRIGVLAERLSKAIQLIKKCSDRDTFAFVDGMMRLQERPQILGCPGRIVVDHSRRP